MGIPENPETSKVAEKSGKMIEFSFSFKSAFKRINNKYFKGH